METMTGPYRRLVEAIIVIGIVGMTSCQSRQDAQGPSRAVDDVELNNVVELTFWHRQTGRAEELQQQLINEFMLANPNVKIKSEFVGDYAKLYQKTLAAIQAGSPPDLVAAFETQAAEYYEADALVPFDDYLNSTRYGLAQDELEDLVPSFLAAAKFPQYGGKMLTFPYTKSALVLYSNMDALRVLGIEQPARTWSEFLVHCRSSVAAGRRCYPLTGDASTFSAFVYSFGGQLISEDGKRAILDDEATRQALRLFETLGTEKLGYRVSGDDDVNELVSGSALYIIKSSIMIRRMGPESNDARKWRVSSIPQGTPEPKPTVLFGANFAILKTTAEKQLAAWLFVKYFTRSDVTARWGLDPAIGYFPVRVSALSQPSGQQFLASTPQFQEAFAISSSARPEPNVRGWQQVRSVIEDSVTTVFVGQQSAEQAQGLLNEKANKLLEQ